MSQIPRIIHLTCRNKRSAARYESFLGSIRQWNPGWELRIYDDREARELIAQHFPQLLHLYDGYRLPVQRADIFRIAVVYLHGGFYMDMDMFCLRSLDSLCEHPLVLGVEKVLSAAACASLEHKHEVRIANYMFGSVAGHPFWLTFLEAAALYSHKPVISENDVLETTGLDLLTNVYHEQKDNFPDMHLLPNDRYKCVKSCSGQPSCHFGDYAAHTHMGSWRWEHKAVNLFGVCNEYDV